MIRLGGGVMVGHLLVHQTDQKWYLGSGVLSGLSMEPTYMNPGSRWVVVL